MKDEPRSQGKTKLFFLIYFQQNHPSIAIFFPQSFSRYRQPLEPPNSTQESIAISQKTKKGGIRKKNYFAPAFSPLPRTRKQPFEAFAEQHTFFRSESRSSFHHQRLSGEFTMAVLDLQFKP
ncbi:mating-type protein A-1 [Striga asiatica]|uniref:Mating-type protein A-1 n=1 Tax=Striga asiatica TaxID=4170 RepID=A0A5A7PQB0_STRAF|nr:mating-type protein A-1 [Striga asiatica]